MKAHNLRETYYEVYKDGHSYYQGTYDECMEIFAQALDDDLCEVFYVEVNEAKIA